MGAGANTIAIEALHYVVNPNGMATDDAPPMIATLVVEYADGTLGEFCERYGLENCDPRMPATGGSRRDFDDSGWKAALVWQPLSARAIRVAGASVDSRFGEGAATFVHVEKPVKSARLYATALGAYEMFLNGKRVGDQVLAPGWTDYRERVVYQTYDVTALVAEGKNAIGALLAPGWYETPLEWFQQPNNYGDHAAGAAGAVAHRAHRRQRGVGGDGRKLAGAAHRTFSTLSFTTARVRMRGSRKPGWETAPDFRGEWLEERDCNRSQAGED